MHGWRSRLPALLRCRLGNLGEPGAFRLGLLGASQPHNAALRLPEDNRGAAKLGCPVANEVVLRSFAEREDQAEFVTGGCLVISHCKQLHGHVIANGFDYRLEYRC